MTIQITVQLVSYDVPSLQPHTAIFCLHRMFAVANQRIFKLLAPSLFTSPAKEGHTILASNNV